jgi:hypothetical protein
MPDSPLHSAEPLVRWLFLDLNSYFASVEQELQPHLRGKPVAVVPLMADTTSCIAASYEAKAFGVKTGVKVGDAKRMCPGLQLVEARHKEYVDYHHRIIEAVERCVPVSACGVYPAVLNRPCAEPLPGQDRLGHGEAGWAGRADPGHFA